MTSREKIAIGALILIGLICWGVIFFRKDLNDFLFYYWLSRNPQIFSAEIDLEQQLRELKPIRNKEIADLEITAKSAISVLIKDNGEQKTLFEKDAEKTLPIASLTKLMTAKIALKYYDLSQEVKISKEAVLQAEEFGKLKVGQTFPVKYLLYPLLIESSNDAAFALAEAIGKKAFVDLMNSEAKNLGLENTYFVNSTGLDPGGQNNAISYSTTKDLVKLTKHLLKEKPLIWEILSFPEFDLYSPDGIYHHKLKNTNELLGEIPSIVGGKTGETPRAGGCLLLVSKAPKNKGYLINIILGSKDRFEEMRNLIEQTQYAYDW